MIVQKYSSGGTLLWERQYNGAANLGDRVLGLYVDASYNVYTVGAVGKSKNSSNMDIHDICVIKYSSSGVQQWVYFYNGNGNDDIGTSITSDGNFLYITGASAQTTTLYDYDVVVIKLSLAGAQQWVVRDGLGAGVNKLQFPGQIYVRSGYYYVTGYAQGPNGPLTGNIVQWKGQVSNGAISQYTNVGSTEFALASALRDFFMDGNNNLYIAGSEQITSSVQMRVWKLNYQLQNVLNLSRNPYGTTSIAKSVKVDAAGNIYVFGYANHPVERNNFILLKYNAAGVLQWQREYNGDANGNDNGEHLALLGNNYVVVTGSSEKVNEGVGVRTLLYDTNGNLLNEIWHKYTPGSTDIPVGIAVDNQNHIVISATSTKGAVTNNLVFKYKVYERASQIVIDSEGAPSHVAGEIIIRFHSNYVNRATIDRKGKQAGRLNEFVSSSVITALGTKLGFDVSRLETYKIYNELRSIDTLSQTRDGKMIRIDDFWATFVVKFPKEHDEEWVIDNLNTVKEYVQYAELQRIFSFSSIPYDMYYNSGIRHQAGLFDLISGINVQKAWDLQVGQSYVKVGVFDTGINWRHQDLGNGTWSGSKVKWGKDYVSNILVQNQTIPDSVGHGTAIGGVIAALRNNGYGIAGIAGGDVLGENNIGAILHSYKTSFQLNGGDTTLALTTTFAAAILEGALNINNSLGQGVHVQNHSWVSYPPGNALELQMHNTLRKAIYTAYQNGCILIAGSGNFGGQSIYYPFAFPNEWLIGVGANDETGARALFSSYGSNVDVIAPGVTSLYRSLDHNNNSGYNISGNGTSIATAHVSGVATLLYSQHNPLNDSRYPNVLSQEDIEYVLKRGATWINTDISVSSFLPQPNIYTGYGRVNADSSLKIVSLPYRIRHFQDSVRVAFASLYSSNYNISFSGIQLPVGHYIDSVDVYKLTRVLSFSIPTSESVIDVWERNSACDLYGLDTLILDSHWAGTRVDSFSGINKDVTMSGYVYHARIYNNLNQHVQDIWLPKSLGEYAKFSYSVYTVDSMLVNLENISSSNINIFPNPVDDLLHVDIEGLVGCKSIEIIDITGKFVGGISISDGNVDKIHESINVSALASGMYFCRITLSHKHIVKKFIKK